MKGQTIGTITVLPVSSIEESAKWYELTFGFCTTFLNEGDEDGEATNYAILKRDEVTFHLILDESPDHGASWTKAGSGYLYLLVSDVKKEYDDVKSRGAKVSRELQVENWGATGFNLRDPSGNEIHVEQVR